MNVSSETSFKHLAFLFSKYYHILCGLKVNTESDIIKHMQFYTYRIIIEPDENNAFHGYVPALPGCHTWGQTIQETRKNIRDAIDVYLRSLQRDGEKIPEDRGIEVVETIPAPTYKKRTPAYA